MGTTIAPTAAAMAGTGLIFGGLSLFFLIIWCLIMLFMIAVMILWIWAIIDVAKREFKKSDNKTLWLLVVILAGWIGAIIYYFLVVRNPKEW